MQKNNLIIASGDTLVATASNGVLSFTGNTSGTFIPVIYKRIKSGKKTAGTAGTAAVKEVTITRAASTEYGLTIVRSIGSTTDNQPDAKTMKFFHTSSTTAASGSSIADAFVAQINSVAAPFGVTAAKTGDAVFTITTVAANPVINVGVISGVIAVADTTSAVVPVNTGAQLIAEGITAATSGINYTSYEISCEKEIASNDGVSRFQNEFQVFYVDPANTTAVATLDAVLNAPVNRSNAIKRYTAAQIAALTDADFAGATVYQTDGTVGYYYCDGSAFVLITGEINLDELFNVGI
jgi:hypothetical protein